MVKGYKYLAEPDDLMPELVQAITHNASNGKIIMASMNKVHTYITSKMLRSTSIRANNRNFREAGGIEVVLNVLATNKNELVLRECTRLVLALAKDELNSEALRKLYAPKIFESLLNENKGDEFIEADVKQALATMQLSCIRLEVRRIQEAKKRRVVEPLFQALENQCDNREIVVKALTVLDRLGEESVSLDVLYEKDELLGYLLNVLKIHHASAKTQILGQRILFAIGKDPNLLTVLARQGSLEVVKRALQNHPNKLDNIQAAIWVLRQFTRTEKLKARLDQSGVAIELRECVQRAEEENLGMLIMPLPIRRMIKETSEADQESGELMAQQEVHES